MRPEKAKMIADRAIDFFLKTGDATKLYEAFPAFTKLDEVLRRDFKRMGVSYDERTPQSIGMMYNKKYVANEMMYISDRIMAPHRMNWLLKGSRDKLFGKFKHKG